ncbi:glycosyltransferase [Candidatus Pelagibacter sp.]|nr:glycosyltransferase [Candidatus Pelagibacter sp.]
MNKVRVSVIVNCYNGEKFIFKSINSILNQTHLNYEIIFFDNASTDNSRNIIKKFKNKKIKIYNSKKLLKLYNARNKAIKHANGQFIAFLDVDDWWHKNKLEKQLKLMLKEKTKICFSNFFIYKNKKKKIFRKIKDTQINDEKEFLNNYPVSISSLIINRNLFNKNRFNTKYEIIGDFDLVMRLIRKYKFSYIKNPLLNYRDHNSNRTKIKFLQRLKEMDYWINNQLIGNIYTTDQIKVLNDKNNYWRCKYDLGKKNYKNFKKNIKKIPISFNIIKLTYHYLKSLL